MATIGEQAVVCDYGEVTQVVINRPESGNALNADVFRSLIQVFDRLEREGTARVVTLWGGGQEFFSVGLDLYSMRGLGPAPRADFLELGQRALRRLETCRVPVIVALNGNALGAGLELALAGDIVIAAHQSELGFPEVRSSLPPAVLGGLARPVLRAGEGLVRRLALTGQPIGATVAAASGLVDWVADPGSLGDEVQSVAEAIVKGAPLAVQSAKILLGQQFEQQRLYSQRLAVEHFGRLSETADYEEALIAFNEQRLGSFTGR